MLSLRSSLAPFALTALGLASPFACKSSAPAAASSGDDDSGANEGDDAGVDATADTALPPYVPDGSYVDDSIIATTLSNPTALTVVGQTLFWIERDLSGNGLGIKSVGLGGGTPASVVTSPGLDGNLASDGTSLYFTGPIEEASAFSTVLKCDLDGSGLTTLTQGQFSTGPTSVNQLFLVGGTLYFQSTIAGTPGPTTILSGAPTPVPIPAPGAMTALYWADPSGLYFGMQDHETHLLDYETAPLAGNTNNDLFNTPDATVSPAGLAVVNGEVYIATWTGGTSRSSTVLKLTAATPADGGAVTPLASLPNWTTSSIAADANGMYLSQVLYSNAPGVYAMSMTTGATTLVKEDPSASAYGIALDATNVYWLEQTSRDTGQATLHAKAR